ncbi:MAG: VanZ family protein [Candidatus Omnitrophica bacterium]|nr:VanZ family protein [Candidatus Omnitrophota bacterium]
MAAGRPRYWFPVLFFMWYIFYVSGQTGDDIPSLFAFQDVVFHFCIYALLGWSFARALFFEMPRAGMLKIVCVCAVFGLLYGVSDEYHQSFVSGRSSEIFDIVIDTAGSLFGGILVRWLR